MSEEEDDSSRAGHDIGYIESVAAHPTPPKNRYHFDQSDLDRVQRRLKQRHVQMFVCLSYAFMVLYAYPCLISQDCRECLLPATASFVPMILSRTDRGDYWNRFIPWVRICTTRCGTSGRIVGIRLGWHGGLFVRASTSIVGRPP